MEEKIKNIRQSFSEEIEKVSDLRALEEIRIKYLSRKGSLSVLFDEFKALPKEEKPKFGKDLNVLKNFVNDLFNAKKAELESASSSKSIDIDLSLPGRSKRFGTTHVLTQVTKEIRDIFKGLGFSVYEGPELESDYYNFEQLNFPDDHPARDMQDTFFINDKFLMRTHTSPVQIRLMEKVNPPLRAIMPGRVFRNEAISAKSYCLFHQVEGLVVDENITFAELKATLVYFARQFFGENVKFRFRPSFFPFTEPSAEVDIWW
ncbi:MAG: phenylalanine--tRNA ligase subunit alpha, partial [Ignavibacteria bacterium]